MSGPKSAMYTVISNAELRRRAREEARRAAEEVARRARALALEVSLDIPEIDFDADPQANLEAWAAEVSARCRSAEEALAGRRTAAHLDLMLGALATPASARPAAAPTDGTHHTAANVGPPAGDPAPASTWHARHRDRVRAVVAGLSGSATPGEVDEIEALARRALGASAESDGALLVDELRLRTHDIAAAADRRRQAADEAVILATRLHGLEGADVESVQAQLRAVEAGDAPLTGELREEVARVAEAARRAADRLYTAQVISGALVDLGYEVEEGFTTLAMGSGDAHAARWPAHAVRVRFTTDGALALRVVREAGDDSDDQRRQDREIEHEFCRDFARLSERLEREHIRLRMTSQVMPGDEPVETVDRLRARRNRSAPAARWAVEEHRT